MDYFIIKKRLRALKMFDFPESFAPEIIFTSFKSNNSTFCCFEPPSKHLNCFISTLSIKIVIFPP